MYRKYKILLQQLSNTSNTTENNRNEHEDKECKVKMQDEMVMVSDSLTRPPPQPPPLCQPSSHDKGKDVDPVFLGDVTIKYPSLDRIVRIFTSSTFTDTMNERNTLMERSYPKIKAYCQERGYEFQVVDMRWGVRDEATDDHMGTDLCLRELEKCQTISTGPNFVSLLSHKYGYRSLLREVDAVEFEKILEVVENQDDKNLLQKWFKRDDNAVPPVYVLTSVSQNLPDFVSSDRDKKMAARNTWWEESEQMQTTLASISEKLFGLEATRKYIVSVTEKEVEKGVLENNNTEGTCLWIKRNITDINDQEPCRLLSRHKECLGDEEKWKESQRLLSDLRDKRMMETIPEHRILKYNVNWTEKGIDKEFQQHKDYLEKMCTDFEKSMLEMIDKALLVKDNSHQNDLLYEECVQHLSFCNEKCRDFQGRTKTLSVIKDYIMGTANAPLVIHGHSGCGKTSLLSMAAKQTWSWLDGNCLILLRYIGTTPDSSNIVDLLSSVVNQLNHVFGIESQVDKELKALSEALLKCLTLAEPQRKIVLILDSLDQFDTTPGVKQLKWLPTELPNNVKILVSTLNDPKYEYFKTLQRILDSKKCFVKVPDLRKNDVNIILTHWLEMNGRALTSKQRQCILDAFKKCSLPLFLKLSFDEACKWHSYTTIDNNSLQTTVRKSIDCLFTRVELMHGQILVSKALGYLTVSKNGLSTSELEDILSCDDDVLNDLYSHWTPPQRRMPPLILVRMKADLDQYFVERGVDGVRVFYWYHRQFIEASQLRYCNNAAMLHTGLANFFSGLWANGCKKPFVDKHGKENEAERFVMSQPLRFGDRYNKRKLNQLPHHMILSGERTTALKQECLCNFEFLQSKLVSSGIRHVLEDFILANTHISVDGKKDTQLELLQETLVLSQQALIYDPYQLAPQMMNRLSSHTEVLEDFVNQCRKCQSPYIYPDTEILLPPGGQLVAILTGHTENVREMDISSDGSLAVTSADDETVRIWDLQHDRELKTIDGIDEPQKVLFGCEDKKIIIQAMGQILILDHPSWEREYNIESEAGTPMFCEAGKDKSILVEFHEDSCNLYDLKTRENIEHVQHSKEIMFNGRHGNGVMFGSENCVAVTDTTSNQITVLNLRLKSFGPKRRAFKDRDKAVSGLAITKDEQFLIVADCLDNDLHFKDINSLATIRTVKGATSDMSMDYQITRDGKFLFFPSRFNMVVWNLDTNERSVPLEYTEDFSCVKSVDLNIILTLSDDCVIRKWDLTKSNNKGKMKTEDKIKRIEPFPNSRYVLCLCAFKEDDSKHDKLGYCFKVFDLLEKTVVRQAIFVDNPPSVHHIVDDMTVAIVTKTDQKLKLVDTNTMAIKLVFEGKTHTRYNDFVVLKQGTEIAILSRHRKKVKIFETNKSQAKAILKGGQQERIRNIQANSKSTILLAITDDSKSYLIFNLLTSQCMRTLHTGDLQVSELSYYSFLTGSHVGILTTIQVPFEKETDSHKDELSDDDLSEGEDDIYAEEEEERVVSVWNLDEDCLVGNLMDREYIDRYRTEPYQNDLMKEYSASVEYEMAIIDDTHILTAHDDHILRVWNVKTRKLVKRLHGHKSVTRIKVVDSGPYFLTYGEWHEENSLRLWDRKTFECVATFTLDDTMSAVEWLKDGRSFITTTQSSHMIHWTIHNVGGKTEVTASPTLFDNKVCDITLALENEDDKIKSPGDLDTDTDTESVNNDEPGDDQNESDAIDSIHDDDDDEEEEEEEEEEEDGDDDDNGDDDYYYDDADDLNDNTY